MEDTPIENIILGVLGIVVAVALFFGVVHFLKQAFRGNPQESGTSESITTRKTQEQKMDENRDAYERAMEQSRQRIRDSKR